MAKFNYFDQMVKQYGENWIVALKPEDIQRSAKRIVKDMVKGIDYQVYGNYFLDGKFLDNLMIAVNNELEVNKLYLSAVTLFAQTYPYTPNIGTHLTHLKALYQIYGVIYSKLDYVKHTGSIGYLADISALLYNYKNHLN